MLIFNFAGSQPKLLINVPKPHSTTLSKQSIYNDVYFTVRSQTVGAEVTVSLTIVMVELGTFTGDDQGSLVNTLLLSLPCLNL